MNKCLKGRKSQISLFEGVLFRNVFVIVIVSVFVFVLAFFLVGSELREVQKFWKAKGKKTFDKAWNFVSE